MFSCLGPKPNGVSSPMEALLGLRCDNGVDAATGDSLLKGADRDGSEVASLADLTVAGDDSPLGGLADGALPWGRSPDRRWRGDPGPNCLGESWRLGLGMWNPPGILALPVGVRVGDVGSPWELPGSPTVRCC